MNGEPMTDTELDEVRGRADAARRLVIDMHDHIRGAGDGECEHGMWLEDCTDPCCEEEQLQRELLIPAIKLASCQDITALVVEVCRLRAELAQAKEEAGREFLERTGLLRDVAEWRDKCARLQYDCAQNVEDDFKNLARIADLRSEVTRLKAGNGE